MVEVESDVEVPVVVNDPTVVVARPKTTAYDVVHFFIKGKDGAKTVCKICLYVNISVISDQYQSHM